MINKDRDATGETGVVIRPKYLLNRSYQRQLDLASRREQMNPDEESNDEYLCYSELLAELYLKFKNQLPPLPRQPIAHVDDGDYQPCPLPELAATILGRLDAPPRLVAHLALVHDTAVELTDGILAAFPRIEIDAVAIRFGAATHDIGKLAHRNELEGPGNQHERDGALILLDLGIPEPFTRFTRTHGAWSSKPLPLDDLLVALSDTVWKGQRLEDLESLVVAQLAEMTATEPWETFSRLDGILDQIASRGNERLAWQVRRA